MDLSSLFNEYFISPIWERTGYNAVNTAVYAILALGALYILWRLFKKHDVKIDAAFWAGALAWSVWGSSIRVLTDSVDAGTMAGALAKALAANAGLPGIIAKTAYPAILQSHILDYGFATITPGIYIVTAALFLGALLLERKLGLRYWAAGAGGLAALLNLFLLLPMAQYWIYAMAPVVLMLAVGALLYWGLKWREPMHLLPVMGQALDGAATWMAIDWFGPAMGSGYFEQHVLSSAIGTATPLGFGLFFILKVVFAAVAVDVLRKEKMDDNTRNMALLVIAIIGFAPGLRDLLRVLCGT